MQTIVSCPRTAAMPAGVTLPPVPNHATLHSLSVESHKGQTVIIRRSEGVVIWHEERWSWDGKRLALEGHTQSPAMLRGDSVKWGDGADACAEVARRLKGEAPKLRLPWCDHATARLRARGLEEVA